MAHYVHVYWEAAYLKNTRGTSVMFACTYLTV